MLTQFLLTSNPAEQGQHLLIFSRQPSFLTAVQRRPGQDVQLNTTCSTYSGFYGPKNGMLIVHFVLTASTAGEEPEEWTYKLLLEAIRYYNAQLGMTDLMLVLQHYPVRSLFERAHSLVKQLPAPPAVWVDHQLKGEHLEYLD